MDGSADRAVFVLKSKLPKVFGAALLSGVAIIVAAAAVVFVKLQSAVIGSVTSLLFLACFVGTAYEMGSTTFLTQLGRSEDGKVRLEDEEGTSVDVGNLELPSSLEKFIS